MSNWSRALLAEVAMTGALGLSTAEAEERLRQFGPNALPKQKSGSVIERFLTQLRDPMILLLIGACAVTITIGDTIDSLVILAVIVLNSFLGVSQEVRAERALDALSELAAPTAKVIRDGVAKVVAAREVVPRDLLRLDAGDVVPADAHVLAAHGLQIDESAVTGESVPVDVVDGNDVRAGTVVTRGRATSEVTRTGSHSTLGQIAELVASAPTRATPLQGRLSRLSRSLVLIAILAAALIFVLGLLQGRGPGEMLVVAVSLAVAAVPESLPAVVAVALALGAFRMARRSAIVRSLPAVETLGSVTVIASDKAGTLTEGQMVARKVWTSNNLYVASGHGYSPEGELSEQKPNRAADVQLEGLLRAIVLCNDAHLVPPAGTDGWAASGDPLEAALLAIAEKAGFDAREARLRWPRSAEVPFDSERRIMTTTHHHDLDELTIIKGAPEQVLKLTGQDPDSEASRAARDLTDEGFRVIAVAQGFATRSGEPGEATTLDLLGLVAISDQPRATARGIVDSCRDAGVKIVMVTGDHPATARAVANSVGITYSAPLLVQGDDIDAHGLPDRLDDVGVYARTRPGQKVEIVNALQRAGHVVAVTGDGVNDAPALRAADIGVAMGHGGTEVARQAADLVLANDDLRSVIVAIEEGRRILANIRRFLRYALSGGLAEIIVLLLAPFAGIAMPLLPAQILWINLVTHGIPGVAFGTEPVDPALMTRPPATPGESVLGGGLGRQIAIGGGLIAVVTLLAGIVSHVQGLPVQTVIFLVLGIGQLALALALRVRRPRRGAAERGLELAVCCAAVLHLAAVYTPALQDVLHTRTLDLPTLALAVAVSIVPAGVVRIIGD
jgi:Ca2+-transporting ATPase